MNKKGKKKSMRHYKIIYIDYIELRTKEFECDALSEDDAYYMFEEELIKKYGSNSSNEFSIKEFYENGVYLKW